MKKDRIYNIAIVALLVIISVVVYGKFFHNKPQNLFEITNIDTMKVYDGAGAEMKFSDLLETGTTTYCLLFNFDDCHSCIFKGIDDLNLLKKSGKPCFGLAVHHMTDEVAGWSTQQEFSPFYMLKKADFYEFVRSPTTPVLVKIKDGKVTGFRFITP